MVTSKTNNPKSNIRGKIFLFICASHSVAKSTNHMQSSLIPSVHRFRMMLQWFAFISFDEISLTTTTIIIIIDNIFVFSISTLCTGKVGRISKKSPIETNIYSILIEFDALKMFFNSFLENEKKRDREFHILILYLPLACYKGNTSSSVTNEILICFESQAFLLLLFMMRKNGEGKSMMRSDLYLSISLEIITFCEFYIFLKFE